MSQNPDPTNPNPDLIPETSNNVPNTSPLPEQFASAESKEIIEYKDLVNADEEKIKEEIDNIILKDLEKELIEEIENEKNILYGNDSENEDEDEDKDKWIPKYKDCECCYGFVYSCKGDTCASLGQCFCKMKDDIEEEEKEENKLIEDKKEIDEF